MQTTLRLDDKLYREAKAEAARQGMTLTRFLEEALRLRLNKQSPKSPGAYSFQVYDSGREFTLSDAEIKRIDNEEQESFYLRKIGLEKAGQ